MGLGVAVGICEGVGKGVGVGGWWATVGFAAGAWPTGTCICAAVGVGADVWVATGEGVMAEVFGREVAAGVVWTASWEQASAKTNRTNTGNIFGAMVPPFMAISWQGPGKQPRVKSITAQPRNESAPACAGSPGRVTLGE